MAAWLGSSAAWFVLLNVVVGAIFALSTRAQPPSPRRAGSGITRSASSALLQRLRSFSVFSSIPSPGFHMEAAPEPDSPATLRGPEEVGTAATTWSPSTPRAVQPPAASEEPTTPAKQDEEDADSMSMDDVYALVLAGRHQPPPTEEEAARSEVDAKAEEFIQGFREDLKQQRLHSIFNHTQMLKRRAGGR